MKLDIQFNTDIFIDGVKRDDLKPESDPLAKQSEKELIAELRRTLIFVAERVLKEQQSLGFDKDPVVTVDGNSFKSVQEVKPFGKIVYTSKQAMDIVLGPIYEALLRRSPVDTGLYRDSHFVFFNGKQVANTAAGYKAWIESGPKFKDGDVIRFVNVMPYAGKLEREGRTVSQRTGANRRKKRMVKSTDKPRFRSGVKVRAPNGTYFLTVKSLARLYKYNSNIRFEWINGRRLDLSEIPKTNRRGGKLRTNFKPNSKGKSRGPYVYPSIVIRINEKGFTK